MCFSFKSKVFKQVLLIKVKTADEAKKKNTSIKEM